MPQKMGFWKRRLCPDPYLAFIMFQTLVAMSFVCTEERKNEQKKKNMETLSKTNEKSAPQHMTFPPWHKLHFDGN